MKKIIITIAAVAALSLTGCATIAENAAAAARGVADFQCDRSLRERLELRGLYYDQTGRVLVGYCPDDDGYDAAVKKFITEPRQIHGEVVKSILQGDYKSIVPILINAGADNADLQTDDTGCIVHANGWRNCPPPRDSDGD